MTTLTEADRKLAAGFAGPLETAHGITRIGMCKVSGRHLSEAQNMRDLGSPEETAARNGRIEAATAARKARSEGLYAAKALIRKYGIRTNDEFLAFLQCVRAAIPVSALDTILNEYADKVADLCADYDDEWNGTGEQA